MNVQARNPTGPAQYWSLRNGPNRSRASINNALIGKGSPWYSASSALAGARGTDRRIATGCRSSPSSRRAAAILSSSLLIGSLGHQAAPSTTCMVQGNSYGLVPTAVYLSSTRPATAPMQARRGADDLQHLLLTRWTRGPRSQSHLEHTTNSTMRSTPSTRPGDQNKQRACSTARRQQPLNAQDRRRA